MKSLFLILPLVLAPLSKSSDDFEWHETLSKGMTLEIRGVSGDISATSASAQDAFVTAHKSARRDDPSMVEVHVVPSSSGFTICAVYPDSKGDAPAEGCPERQHDIRSDVEVRFEVKLPEGVRLVARTVNGAVKGSELLSEVDAHSVNGGIRLSTSNAAQAETVNGSIEATLGALPAGKASTFRTVNGSIHLTLPRSVDAKVSARTVNGNLRSGFPMTAVSRHGEGNLEGTLGSGAATLTLETVNGSVVLQPGS
jgi:DUF4097 and DUF4098 domain-containing protein YvlB